MVFLTMNVQLIVKEMLLHRMFNRQRQLEGELRKRIQHLASHVCNKYLLNEMNEIKLLVFFSEGSHYMKQPQKWFTLVSDRAHISKDGIFLDRYSSYIIKTNEKFPKQ